MPPSRPPPPSNLPPRSLKSQRSQPTSAQSSTESGHTMESKAFHSASRTQLSVSPPEGETEAQDQRTSNTPSPATGQLRPEAQEVMDGMCTYTCNLNL